MKTKAILLISFITLCFTLKAQTKSDIFLSKTPISWLGLDFTATSFVGDRDIWKDTGHTHEIIESLNTLLTKESEKYDIASAIDKDNVEPETRVTMLHNSKLNMDNQISDTMNEHFFKPDDIQVIVSKYDFKGLSGIGLMFNIETFNKTSEQAIIWITFINMNTKEVLITEKIIQSPSGFGIRNYWAGAIYKTIKDIQKDDYSRWRRKYYRKDS